MEWQIEQRLLNKALLRVLGVPLPWEQAVEAAPLWMREQGIGEACGRDAAQIQRCTSDFGPQGLPVLCRTCPGPGK